MLMFLYHFLWTPLLVFLMVIAWPLKSRRINERLALKLPSASLDEGNIWVHALSVGEVVSAVPLVHAINLKYPDRDLVFTVATSKGMALARSLLQGKVKALFTMPVDNWWSVRRAVGYVRPSIFVLVETDIWPALVEHLRKKGVRSILVNGRISPRTFRAYRRFSFFVQKIFTPFESCLMQSDLDRERLLKIGTDPEKVLTAGNIKFDRDWAPMGLKEREKRLGLLGLGPENTIWVAGSTHWGEEEVLFKVLGKLKPSFPALRLILAPRRIEESRDILNLARDMGLKAVLKTKLSKNGRPYDVLILDTLGELGRIYGLGMLSFVGGSLVSMGGHNLLEPASFGCPVLFGPHTHNFIAMSEALIESGGGWRVEDGTGLFEAMKTLLKDPDKLNRMGRSAKEFVETNQGALKRVMSYIYVERLS
ncbi:MAG: 3-deoxy-D-manno-octulosonic acid transferase [Deltaproteobacteria bacterium]|nr:3-deoxy-D-manno-octulosonic acid transferase [Deltaproteobacteria bacterium]